MAWISVTESSLDEDEDNTMKKQIPDNIIHVAIKFHVVTIIETEWSIILIRNNNTIPLPTWLCYIVTSDADKFSSLLQTYFCQSTVIPHGDHGCFVTSNSREDPTSIICSTKR